MRKRICFVLAVFALCLVCFAFGASAEEVTNVAENETEVSGSVDREISGDIYFMANTADRNTCVYTQSVKDADYLFLPSSADLTKLALYFDSSVYNEVIISSGKNSKVILSGAPFDLTSICTPDDGEYTVNISAGKSDYSTSEATVVIMKSANIKAMYLVSDDIENEGRAWVETSKSNEATGLISVVDAKGKVTYSNTLTQLKCRGNSTFTDFVKKAYQIKIGKKADLIGGNKSEENKKWVLLANAADITLIHNQITFALAKNLAMPYTPQYESVDLYYDGEYRGTYTLTEKTEVGSSRLDIENLDDLIEEANKDNPAYDTPEIITATTASKGETEAKENSAGSYKYVSGLNEPELAEGTNHHGYLLEIEFIYRYPNEMTGFVTKRGQSVLTDNPEYLTKETGAYISQFYQDFEDAVYSKNGYNTKTGKYYYEYCDLESLAKLYLINEIGKNYDSFRSSTYFYLPADSDIMYAGPVWDYDICYGTGYNGNRQTAGNPENFFASTKYLATALLKIESFRDEVKQLLNSEDGEFYIAAEKLLGENGTIKQLSDNIYDSQKMNYTMWNISDKVITALFCDDECTYENGINFLQWFVSNRIDWLSSTTSKWSGSSYSVPVDSFKYLTYRFHKNIVTTPATSGSCTEDGKSQGIACSDCSTVFLSPTVVPGSGHDWQAADCTTPETCKICGETRGEALGHSYVYSPDDEENTPYCRVFVCSRCGQKMFVTTDVTKGDLNMDGNVNAADARLALRISAGLVASSDELVSIGDMNGDKLLNAADARTILRKSAKLE